MEHVFLFSITYSLFISQKGVCQVIFSRFDLEGSEIQADIDSSS